MITRLSEPVNGLEIWRRVRAGEQRSVSSDADAIAALSSHGKQRSSLGGVGTSCTAVRGTEFGHAPGHNQSSNTGTQPTGFVRLSATRLQEYDALRSMWKKKGKGKRKEKGKSKDKSKEETSGTSNTKCSFCKGKDRPKSLSWPAEKKTMAVS